VSDKTNKPCRRVAVLQQRIVKAQKELKQIQDECPHPKETLDKKFGGNTDNYDPHSDSYWVTLHCGVCDRGWVVYSDDPEYRRYR